MKLVKYIIITIVLTIIGYVGWKYAYRASCPIEDVIFDRDFKQIDELFHKGDNWPIMIHKSHLDTYSVEYMLKNKASCQYSSVACHNDLITKVYRENDKVVGFCAYYPHSKHVWQFLFLLVDQDYRGKGIARKMLQYAVSDMVVRGAVKVQLYTRSDNFKAQSLYKKFGFKQFAKDENGFGIWLSWFKRVDK